MDSAAPDSVLVVDDDPAVLDTLRRTLERGEFAIRTAGNAREALAALETAPAAVVIADFEMPGDDGVVLLQRVRALWPQTQRMLLSGYADHQTIEAANLRGDIDRFVVKPWDGAQLRIAVRSALAQHRVDVENARLQATLEERVRARTAQLAQAKREWEQTFDAISDPLSIVAADRTVRRANRAYAQLGGRQITAVTGLRCHEALFRRGDVCEGCPLDEAAQDGASTRSRIQIGGRSYRVLAYPLAAGEAVCSYRDVTMEEAVARQLVQTEKLSATGQLAAGVAHEVNNPLASIISLSQVMKAEQGRNADDLQALGLIESSALRCKRIVEAMLRFVRQPRDAERRKPVELGAVAEEAAALIRSQIGRRDIELRLEAPGQPVAVMGVHSQLVQVLLNLLQNALHAVGERGQVRIFWGPLGGHVALSVHDDGPGIPREIRDRLFEPFFTTKPEGQGTGLGLSISHRILEEHGGSIALESEPGQGTTFTLLFPPLEAAP